LWDCLIWRGVKFGHIAWKEKLMAKGNKVPRNVATYAPLSIKAFENPLRCST